MHLNSVKWFYLKFLSVLILLSGFFLPAHSKEIYIATADSSATTRQITESLQKKISAQLITGIPSDIKNKNAIYIAIGSSALRNLIEKNNTGGVIVSAFTSSQVYHSILETVSGDRKKSITAIYADPSPQHQLRLINLIYKKPTHVAVLLSKKTYFLEKLIEGAARQFDTNLTVEKLTDENNVNQVLNRVANLPVILATPDNNIFNQDNIRHILLTSYRRNQAVIGFSPAMVKAGALASTYSDIEDINAQLAELIDAYVDAEQLPAPQFPKYFKTVVNENVARSLNMIVQDEVMNFSQQPREVQ